MARILAVFDMESLAEAFRPKNGEVYAEDKDIALEDFVLDADCTLHYHDGPCKHTFPGKVAIELDTSFGTNQRNKIKISTLQMVFAAGLSRTTSDTDASKTDTSTRSEPVSNEILTERNVLCENETFDHSSARATVVYQQLPKGQVRIRGHVHGFDKAALYLCPCNFSYTNNYISIYDKDKIQIGHVHF